MDPTASYERAWAAGLFDGEGSVTTQQGIYPHVSLAQVDREVLDRFHDIVGVGKVYGPYKQAGHKPIHQWMATGRANAETVAEAIWPWLSTVKRRQFEQVLDATKLALEQRPARRCKAGLHVLAEVDRVNKGCGPCYRVKHPKTRV